MERRVIRIEEAGTGRSAKNLLDHLIAQGIYVPAFCGGKGMCGKCRVRFMEKSAIPAPSAADLAVLSEDEIKAGIRLACTAPVRNGQEIEILAGDEAGMEVETGFSVGADPGRDGNASGAAGSGADAGCIINASGTDEAGKMAVSGAGASGTDPSGKEIAAAVDIGTTTIAMSAVDTGTGRVLNTATCVNHQRAWGADVISRIDASNRGMGGRLQQSIRGDLKGLLEDLGLPADARMVISGNTTMEHLLQGLPCQTLGVAPYTPVDISLHEYENMTVLPGISTYVGADIVSGIVACGMDQSDEICILVDLGTNGEMAIGCRDRIVCASTAAGPAFEGGNISCGMAGVPGAISAVEIRDSVVSVETIGGAAPAGICGTGVLETMYELLKEEIVDETGCMDDEWIETGFPLADNIVFTAKDVREIQLAKSAIRAGMEILLQVFGADYDDVARLYLAGGFGQKINLDKAVGIGLLPEELLDRMIPVGNSSLAGAVMAARDPAILARMTRVAQMAEETALAESPLFSDLYMDNMFFPEM